jgi:hypothetical protein
MALSEELKKHLEDLGYVSPREIEGRGICALHKFMYTVAIVWGLDDSGYSGRWCYSGMVQAAGATPAWFRPQLHSINGMV